MKSVLLLALFWYWTHGARLGRYRSVNGSSAGPEGADQVRVLVLDADVSAVLRRVDPRYLSVTVDASLAAEETFMLLLRSEKIRTLAGALSPAVLRFGGTRQDFMVFSPERNLDPGGSEDPAEPCSSVRLPRWLEERLKTDWTRQQQVLLGEDLQKKYRQVRYSEVTVDALHSFSACAGLDLVFGLNALLRTQDNRWNSSNAAALLRYCQARRYRMSWELGNEPNSFEKKAGLRVGGSQLGRDFTRLRKMMSASSLYREAGLYGPDVGQPRGRREDILDGFLQTGADAVHACTWHHYYVNGRDASLEDFLDPEVLDSLAAPTQEVLQKVHQVSPGKSVWLGETSSAYGGGAPGLSDAFVAGFMWLDKLGLAARLGLDLVMRQVLVGSGSYHLVDDNLDPLPDYWLSVLYKRLVGPEVLKVEVSGPGRAQRVRAYLHCASRRSYGPGAAVLMTMNLSLKPARISVPASLSSSPLDAFVLQSQRPGEAGLLSRSVRLNGELLAMVDDRTLPPLAGDRLPAAPHLQLPGYALAFHVFLDAGAPACR